MKNFIFLFLFLAFSCSGIAQVGVNTTNPQQKFHVDGKSSSSTTNPNSGTPSVAQQIDDFVITNSGNVGTGTTSPSTRLEINNRSTNGAIKITDGTQGHGKLLVSDDNGVGQWVMPNALKGVVVGTFGKTSLGAGMVVTSDGGGYKYSNVSITLSKGIWMVNMGLTLKSFLTYSSGRWVHFRLSSTNTGVNYNGWQNLGTANNNTAYAGVVFGSAVYNNSNVFQHIEANANNYVNGSNIIEVTDNSVTLYLMIENFGNEPYPSGSTAPNPGVVWQFDTANWENYFYANPL